LIKVKAIKKNAENGGFFARFLVDRCIKDKDDDSGSSKDNTKKSSVVRAKNKSAPPPKARPGSGSTQQQAAPQANGSTSKPQQRALPRNRILDVCAHNENRLVNESYELGVTLGKGSFARVVRAVRNKNAPPANISEGVCPPSGTEVAIKIVKLDKDRPNHREVLNKELEVLRRLDPLLPSLKSNDINGYHSGAQHVVRFFEAFEGDFDGAHSLFMVKELCKGGELFDLITEKERLPERQAGPCMRQILLGIAYTHSCGVSHRCPKPEDILMKYQIAPLNPLNNNRGTLGSDYDEIDQALDQGRLVLQLTDFGMGNTFDPMSKDPKERDGKFTTRQGTPYYVAPEVISGVDFNRMCDLWSAGIILYILLSGYPPFFANSDIEVLSKIKEGKYDFPPTDFDSVSSGAKDLIRNLLKEWHKRWDVPQCLESEYLREYKRYDLPAVRDWGRF